MTEKRFTIFGEWHKDCVIDEIRDNTGEYVTIGRVVDLLNENEQLKHDATVLIQANQDYRRENEQLKSICQDHRNHANDFKADCVRLEKENEQLKQQLMVNNCDNCKYSKAIYADVECRKKGLTEWKCNCDEFNGDFE